MCCCLPVVFVLFKSVGLRSESTWVSIKDWFKAQSRGSSTSKTSSAQGNPMKLTATSDISGRDTLPRAPKGTLSSLISFVRGGSHPKRQNLYGTSTNNQRTESRVELQTFNDYSYHTYLNDRPVGAGRSLDPTNGGVSRVDDQY